MSARPLNYGQERTSSLDELAKLQERAVECSFLKGTIDENISKCSAELSELRSALKTADKDRIEREIADVIFNALMLARYTDKSAQKIVDEARSKFAYRFGYVAAGMAKKQLSMNAENVDAMQDLWQQAKDNDLKYAVGSARPTLVSDNTSNNRS